MTLGALVDLGVDVGAIEAAVQSMGLPELSIREETVKKCGFRAIKVHIEHPPEHAHRHLHHITDMIEGSADIAPEAKKIANRIFEKVAVAEAKVHGTTLKKVHFHEVGAIDSIADIVGTAVALHSLGIDTIQASPVPTGTGSITIAHGRVSIPAPATAELLQGIPIASCDVEAELTTPTGAAILKACAESFGPVPSMTIDKVGYGAGTKDLEGQANVLRVLLGEISETELSSIASLGSVESDRVVVMETNVDDATGEQLADCADRILKAGALDVFQTPCVMKKGRPGVILTAIAKASQVATIENIIFEHSSSIGIRRHTTDRHKLARCSEEVATKFGQVRGKVVTLPSGTTRFTVEDDDARELATTHGTTTSEVRKEAHAVWSR